MSGQNANYVFRGDDEVICSMEYAESTKLRKGEVKFTTRPSDSLSPEIVNFTLARYVRIKFQGKNEFLAPESYAIRITSARMFNISYFIIFHHRNGEKLHRN